MTDTGYTCATCGKVHEGLPTDWGYRLPDEVYALSYLETYRRSRSNADLCTLDDQRHFLRGLLRIPFTHQDGDFAWGVWVEVPKAAHDFYVENFSNDAAAGARFEGRLANALPGFHGTLGAALGLELQRGKSRPILHFPGSAEHALARHQRDGIDAAGHHRFLEACGYFDESGD